jgi:hypothetical protein
MLGRRGWMVLALLLTAPMTAAVANVITDWDDKAVSTIQTGTVTPPPTSFRVMAIVHIAMFDAVNSIERRYKPYKVQLSATPDTSKEAAAAAAAGAVLIKLAPDAASDVQSALTRYLATVAEGEAKSKAIKLGQDVAAKILEARTNDGASAADAYRPKTRPGVYIPTPITAGSQFPNMTPFALTSACAHCILSSSVGAVIEGVLGTDEIPEVSLTSPFVPGVIHRFTNLRAYTDEVADARIYAGFHYHFSTVVGREMGQKIGAYVVKSVMQPVQAAMAR